MFFLCKQGGKTIALLFLDWKSSKISPSVWNFSRGVVKGNTACQQNNRHILHNPSVCDSTVSLPHFSICYATNANTSVCRASHSLHKETSQWRQHAHSRCHFLVMISCKEMFFLFKCRSLRRIPSIYFTILFNYLLQCHVLLRICISACTCIDKTLILIASFNVMLRE